MPSSPSSSRPGEWEIVILGSGASSGTPKLGCLLSKKQNCICNQSPFSPKNKRGNPSILLRKVYHPSPPSDEGESEEEERGSQREKKDFNLLVDCGKTFRECCAAHLPKVGVERMDSILLSHEHADAMGGLDDIREVQEKGGPALPLYADEVTHRRVRECFPYILSSKDPIPVPTLNGKDKKEAKKGSKKDPKKQDPSPSAQRLWTANCAPLLFSPFQPFLIEDLEITPIPLHHGPNLCNGFLFSPREGHSQMAYFSDFRCLMPVEEEGGGKGKGKGKEKGKEKWKVADSHPLPPESFSSLSFFVDPEKTEKLLARKPISIVFLDCLSLTTNHISHSNWKETRELVNVMKKKFFFFFFFFFCFVLFCFCFFNIPFLPDFKSNCFCCWG